MKVLGSYQESVMTVINSVREIAQTPVSAISDGASPVISYNYGAEKIGQMRRAIRFMTQMGFAYTLFIWGIISVFPEFFIRIFNPDPELVKLGERMLRIYAGAFFVIGLNSTFQNTYNALGEGKRAFFFAFYRKGILLIPLLYFFPAVLPWGVLAVMLAEPVSDFITTGTNALYFRHFIKKKL